MAFPEAFEFPLKSVVFEIRRQRLPIPKLVYDIKRSAVS